MAAMMPSAQSGSSSNPYNFDNDAIERDLIDPDDGLSAWPPASNCGWIAIVLTLVQLPSTTLMIL